MKGEARPAMTGTESGSSRALGPSDRVIQRIATADIRPAPVSARKRLNLEELQELSDSIRENGILQPILLRKASDGALEVVPEGNGLAVQGEDAIAGPNASLGGRRAGLDGANAAVLALEVGGGNRIVAGGTFTLADNHPVRSFKQSMG